MTKYQFLIKYYEITKSEHHWIKNDFCLCGINTFCLKNCKIKRSDCVELFAPYAPRFSKKIYEKFKRNHPEIFI